MEGKKSVISSRKKMIQAFQRRLASHTPARTNKEEEGFTLLELIIIVVVIGIIAAIAVPIFMNQQKSALDANLQSDLKNSLLAMQTESAKNKGKFPSYLPTTAASSRGNTVVLIDDAGNSVVDSKLATGNTGWNNMTTVELPPASSSPPPTGNSVLISGRDHMLQTNRMTVKSGDQIEITVTARQTKGDLSLQAGIWAFEGVTPGCAPYLIYPTISDKEPISTYPNGWATYRHIITVPSAFRDSNSPCPDTTMPPTLSVAPFFQISQGHTTNIPHGTNQWEVSNIIYRNLSDLAASNQGYSTNSDGVTVRILQEVCIEAFNEGDPENVWNITNVDGVPKRGRC